MTFRASFTSRSTFSFVTKVYGVLATQAPNEPPTASATANPAQITLQPGQSQVSVKLDGSGSSDPESSPLTYEWGGDTTDPADQAVVDVLLPAGTHNFTLVVRDQQGMASAPATVQVIVHTAPNQPPAADAGDDQEIWLTPGMATASVTLDGSRSGDSDGTLVGYVWNGTPDPDDMMAPEVVLGVGVYTFTLVVTDDDAAQSGEDSVQITVHPAPNQAPVADAGLDQEAQVPWDATTVPVTLNGTGSYDPDPGGSLQAYRWEGVGGAPDPDDQPTPLLSLGTGTYSFTLVVVDNLGLESATDRVQVVVTQATPPSPPTISVGNSFSVAEGGNLQFSLTASDPDGDSVTLAAAPLLPGASFQAASGVIASGAFSFAPGFDQQGNHFITFTARDTLGYTSTRTVQIRVSDVNRPPVLSVPATASVNEGGLLTVGIQVSDPDLDPVTVSATGVPANALFVEPSRTLTFSPDYDQADDYQIGFEASDGKATTGPQTLTVSVSDVQAGAGGGERELVLAVDPVESPTLLSTQRITGTVNAPGGLPPLPTLRSALITGLAPAGAAQGDNLDVVLTGATSGRLATHFNAGTSKADFGAGVTLESLTVTGANQAVARIRVDGRAAPGARSPKITTGDEVAVSANAFWVGAGASIIRGVLIDPDSGQPITDGTVILYGTGFETSIGADGSFELTGVPPGSYRLIINAPNHRLITQPVATRIGEPVELGNVESSALVFDPATGPALTTLSVLGRGLGEPTALLDPDELGQLVTEALLVVGGDEMGVQDTYGNQLNPEISGEGMVTVTSEGVDLIAEALYRGETLPLQEILFALSFGFDWSGGAPIDLGEWLASLQALVDQAWQDPTGAENALTVLVFNRGRTLLPEAPVLSPYTRLNALQSHLFLTSLVTYIYERENGLLGAIEPVMLALGDVVDWMPVQSDAPPLLLLAQAMPPPGGATPKPKIYTRFWRNFFETKSNLIQAQVDVSSSHLIASMALGSVMMTTGSYLGGATVPAVVGPALDAFANAVVNASASRMVPDAPVIEQVVLENQPDGTALAKIAFNRSLSENQTGLNQVFLYDLYRFQGDLIPEPVARGSFGPDAELVLVDPYPLTGTTFYTLRATRYLGVDPSIYPSGNSWWPIAFEGAENVFLIGYRKLASDFSAPEFLYMGPIDFSVTLDGVEVDPDPDKDTVYYSDAVAGALYRIERPGIGTGGGTRTKYANAGFKRSFRDGREIEQVGLAIDLGGNLYCDNAASDAQFGGRIFKFHQPNGARTYAGSINYFSQLLMFANPTLSGPMVIKFDPDPVQEDLYIVDNLAQEIKRVPVNQTYERKVGQYYAVIPPDPQSVGRAIDMEFDPDGNLYLLDGWRVLRFEGGVPELEALFEPE